MQGFGGEGQLHHFNHHHSNRNISYGDHWLFEVVVDGGGSFIPVQSIMYCVSVSAFQAFRGHPNCHRGRIGPGRGCPGRSALVDQSQPVQKSCCTMVSRPSNPFASIPTVTGAASVRQRLSRAFGPRGPITTSPEIILQDSVSPSRRLVAIPTVIGAESTGQSMCRAVGSSGSSTNQTDRPATTWRHTVSPG